jgi:colanic acid/amylovoran biosynthesis glycosyltransferase
MRVAYLVNQYPKVSHSFIRREILALERRGVAVMRIALRGWDLELVDLEDLEERTQTRYVLRDGSLALLRGLVVAALSRPARLLRALSLAWRMGRHSDRPRLVHLAYLAEACRIEAWLREAKIEHLHAHFGTNPAEVAMLVNELGGPPWSFTVHHIELINNPRGIGLPAKIRHCAFVVAISSYGRAQLYRLVEHRHWPKIHLIHCGLDRA